MFVLRINLINNCRKCFRFYSTADSKNIYSKTVLLPSTKLPLRLDNEKLVQRDQQINKINKSLYQWQKDSLNTEKFVLHDGPPYANGALHMGHAINKILKDSIVRAKILQGFKVSFIPGWDCHGLPIELKAIKQKKDNENELSPLQIRQKARNFAKQTIEKQKAGFLSWGIIGDWENAYKTFNKEYIKNQLQQFYEMYEKKLIFRDVKPVYWSPSTRTALAEAELEYNPNHTSISATIKLQTVNVPVDFQNFKNIYLLIWTTTPWTLPANQAVCYNKNLDYSLITEDGKVNYIIAKDLLDEHEKLLSKKFKVLKTFSGNHLSDFTYKHPLYEEVLPVIHADHATASKGTGLVHTAPAHGPEDFLVALQQKIKIKTLVDDRACYMEEAGKELNGLSVLEDGAKKVLEIIAKDIVSTKDYVHSYPYDWRTKKPVILRASKQWFLNMEPIKNVAVAELNNVKILPKVNSEKYTKHLMEQIKKRPYWCISRQRSWGVPIPIFYDKTTGEILQLNKPLIDHLCDVLEKNDADFWWKLTPEELIPQNYLQENKIDIKNIIKGQDILDIWFDSGISWSSVLPKPQIADLYLEGVDQFTGWFQSSLITSVALRNKAPYRCIYVHGFAVDEKGLKMSKSLGNVIDPMDLISKGPKPYGVDTLRWWVACHANTDAIANVSKNVLDVCATEVHKIRSNLRFILGNLSDFREEEIAYNDLQVLDKYILNILFNYKQKTDDYLEEFQFNKICAQILYIITNELSALYYTAIKDRLYCENANSLERKSAQFVLLNTFWVLARSVAPIIPHLAEELYSHLPQKQKDSFFMDLRKNSLPSEWKNDSVQEIMEYLLTIKSAFHREVGASSLETYLVISLKEEQFNEIKNLFSENELCDIFQSASVHLKGNMNGEKEFSITTGKTTKLKCPRCRRHNTDNENCLCDRCKKVVDSYEEETKIRNVLT